MQLAFQVNSTDGTRSNIGNMSGDDSYRDQGNLSEQEAGTASIDSEDGLSEAEARIRLAQYGYNEIREEPSNPFRSIGKRFWGPIPWMLETALALEVFLGKTVEPAMIAGLLLFSAVLGGTQELRAQGALDLLRSRLRVTAKVRRDGG